MMVLKEKNRNEIEEIIRLMKPQLASGYDGITAKLIKGKCPIYIITISIYMQQISVYRNISFSFKIL
jgi:hypothetical protein